MPPIFTRPPTPSAWKPTELAGPYEPLTLREWEVSVATCRLASSQSTLLREALLKLAPAACKRRQHWPLPRRVLPCDEHLLRLATTDTLRGHLLDSLASIWQVLDLPPYAIPGMLRGLLLVGLGVWLRQALAALQRRADARSPQCELEQALSLLGAQVEPAPTWPAPRRWSLRFGKRWWRGAA